MIFAIAHFSADLHIPKQIILREHPADIRIDPGDRKYISHKPCRSICQSLCPGLKTVRILSGCGLLFLQGSCSPGNKWREYSVYKLTRAVLPVFFGNIDSVIDHDPYRS